MKTIKMLSRFVIAGIFCLMAFAVITQTVFSPSSPQFLADDVEKGGTGG
jgi:hypothetical protein